MQKNKNKNYIKATQHKSLYIGKKREIKSKMCNRIKSAQQIRCAKTVYWDLINSNMNKRDVQEGCARGMCKRDVQTGCTGYVHIAAIRMMRILMFYS